MQTFTRAGSKTKRRSRFFSISIGLFVVGIASATTISILSGAINNADARSRRDHRRYTATATTSTTGTSTNSNTTSASPGTTNTSASSNTTSTPPGATNTQSTDTSASPTPTQTSSPTTPATTPQNPSSLPFASSLVGNWSLNGTLQGIGGNGTAHGNISYVAGKFGQAAHFDGNSYIEIPDNDQFSPSTFGQKITVAFWFKPDTYKFSGINEGYVDFLGKADGPGADEWECRIDNETAFDGFSRSERMNFYAFNSTGGLGAGSAINQAAPLDAWTHVTGEIDGTNTKLYINSKLVDSDPLSGYDIHMTNTSAPLRIGTADKESYLQGSISNLMIYNRPLSDTEVAQLYNTIF